MVERQQSSGNLLPKRSKPFDHGITATLLIVFGTFGVAVGGTMTGLAYGFEKRENFTSVAEGYNLRCDIAGPVLLATGGVAVLVAVVIISCFGVCGRPDRSSREVAQQAAVAGNSHGDVEVAIDGNSTQVDGRRAY